MCKEVNTSHKFGEKPYYGFETVTMVPMCRKLIDVKLLLPEEKAWLNDYHQEVYEKTYELVKQDDRALKWLKRETAAY
jgi:Xaa-Pro aminopeptidase